MNGASIDRQMPQGHEVFLDHTGFFAADLGTAGAALERLGFQVSGMNVQYNADSAGGLAPSGTSNRLVKLRRGFLEILAATSETPLADQLRQGLARYEGLHVVALTHPDMVAQRARLVDAGFAMQEPVNLRRRIATPEGERQMAYSVLRTEPGVMPEGRVQMLTTHTPEFFWTPGVTEHANGADALTDLLICVENVREAAGRFGQFTARQPEFREGLAEIALDRGRIVVAEGDRVGAMLPGYAPPILPHIVGQGIRTRDMAVSAHFFAQAGVGPAVSRGGMGCIGPTDALGAYLLFHDRTVARPWTALAACA